MGGRLRRVTALLAMSIAVSVAGAACGSSGSNSTQTGTGASSTSQAATGSSSSLGRGLSQAASIVKAAEVPGAWHGPSSSPKPVKGKRIFVLEAVGASITQIYAHGVENAAKAIGWGYTIYDGNADPKQYAAGLQQALNDHYSGVILLAVTPTLVATQVAALRHAGVPVVAVSDTVPPSSTGINANIGYHPPLEGKILAAAVAQASGGHADALILTDNEFGVVTGRDATFEKWLPKLCAGCKVGKQLAITAGQLNTPALTSEITSTLKADPSLNYVFVGYDDAADSVVEAIRTGGLAGKVKVASFEGTAQNLSYVKQGAIQVADLAAPDLWFGWEAVDALNRIYHHAPLNATVTANEPSRLFTPSNVSQAKLVPSGGWSGDVDFESKYQKIWGVK
jgi:ribose transport system substrate-binding protein